MKPRRGCGVNATHNIGRQIGQAVAAYLKARDAALPWPVRAVDARFWILCCGGLARDGRAAFGCNHLNRTQRDAVRFGPNPKKFADAPRKLLLFWRYRLPQGGCRMFSTEPFSHRRN